MSHVQLTATQRFDVLSLAKEKYFKIFNYYNSEKFYDSYRLNTFWDTTNYKIMTSIISSANAPEDAIHRIQATDLFCINNDTVTAKKRAVAWLTGKMSHNGLDVSSLDSSLQESQFSNQMNTVEFHNRKLTPDFLRTVTISEHIRKYTKIADQGYRVLELGAGCGHLARTLNLRFSITSYYIIDIPETLFFSYIFLQLNFPEKKFLYITEESDFEKIDSGYNFIFIPVAFEKYLKDGHFDLFINTASLGEMRNEIIAYWMHFIQNTINVQYLYTLNRFLNTIPLNGGIDHRLEENTCSLSYDRKWEIVHWELEPEFIRCPYIDTRIARYVEIIAERKQFPDQKERDCSKLLLNDVITEDWFRYRNTLPYCTMRSHTFQIDLTMKGTLFKLWESIRLHKNTRNIWMILIYLEFLCQNALYEFEEVRAYEKEFLELAHKSSNKTIRYKREYIIKRRNFITNNHTKFWIKLSNKAVHPQILVEENYLNMNIVYSDGIFYAIPLSEGAVNLLEKHENNIDKFENNYNIYILKNNILEKHLKSINLYTVFR